MINLFFLLIHKKLTMFSESGALNVPALIQLYGAGEPTRKANTRSKNSYFEREVNWSFWSTRRWIGKNSRRTWKSAKTARKSVNVVPAYPCPLRICFRSDRSCHCTSTKDNIFDLRGFNMWVNFESLFLTHSKFICKTSFMFNMNEWTL